MTRIIVKNFGPLRNCEVEIRKFTVFIGPQGSGKSTMARLYTSLSWIEKTVWRNPFFIKRLTLKEFIKIIGYLQLDSFIEPETIILYESSLIKLKYSHGNIVIEKRSISSYLLPKLLYIPSERSFLSISENFLGTENLPSLFYELSSDYSVARNIIGSKGFDIPVNGFHFSFNKADASSIITDKNRNYKIKLSQAASGIQSVVPLSLIFAYHCDDLTYAEKPGFSIISVNQKTLIQELAENYTGTEDISSKDSPEMNILKAAGIYEITDNPIKQKILTRLLRKLFDFRLSAIIEEPEQNLFPMAQKEVVEFLVSGTNETKNTLLLTTHSPYVLSTLNNLIFAGENSRRKGINEIISKNIQIKYKDVGAYYFTDGSCSTIMDNEIKCINPETIDSCSATINDAYSQMEDIVYASK